MGITRYEQEVVIRWSSDDKAVTIHDYRDKTFRVLTDAGYSPTLIHKIDGEVIGWTWHDIPLSVLKFKMGGAFAIKGSGVPRVQSPAALAYFAAQRVNKRQGTAKNASPDGKGD